jgi:hypothetical protein
LQAPTFANCTQAQPNSASPPVMRMLMSVQRLVVTYGPKSRTSP